MKIIHALTLMITLVISSPCALAQGKAADVAAILKGASIIAQDGKSTYLGEIDNEFGKDSIFNEFSKFGNEFNADSIFNEFGTFGGEFSQFSPFNEFTNKPPMIVKDGKVIGYLTANKAKRGGISVPALLSIKDRL